MPFTLAHPAAAVPLRRFGLPLSALVIGSMAPDFPYFVRVAIPEHYGHTLPGLFLYCIPAGLVVLWLFHRILKQPLLELAPRAHRVRLHTVTAEFRFTPWSRLLLIVLALWIGSVTHIFWDSFTHAGGWAVQHIPALRQPVIHTRRLTVYAYKLLQHGSTALGLALLAFWYHRWYVTSTIDDRPRPEVIAERSRHLILWVISISTMVFAAAYTIFKAPDPRWSGLQLTARGFVISAGIALAAQLLIYCLWWRHASAQLNLAHGRNCGPDAPESTGETTL